MSEPQYTTRLTERTLPGVRDEARAAFLTRTYTHLLGAILAFTGLEFALFQAGVAEPVARGMLALPWLVWLGAFMLAGFIASRFAMGAKSRPVQYLGLGIYVVAEAFIFLPLLFIANAYAPGAIANAALVTIIGFTALTAIVVVTRKDFSFLRTILMWGSVAALGFIVLGAFMGFSGGTIFPVLMIALAGGYILYDTSNVLLHYPEDRHVGAALGLFASVALMFYYVLTLFLSRD